jgi:tetratricopeptide (TPR) repeat protein
LYSTLKWYQKDYQDSTVGFLKVIEDAENNQNQEVLQYGLFGLASSYIMQDEETSALEKLEQIDLDAPDPIRFATYYNIGIIAHKHGEYEKATEAFKQALLIDNTNIDAKINLELSLMENTSHSKAGSQELKPVSESDYQSSIEDTLFSVIRESEQNRWKNTQTQNQQSDILDY